MTAHQRTELFKLVASDDLDKKISYKKCEKIAENLNLTLEQVCFLLAFVREKKNGPDLPYGFCRYDANLSHTRLVSVHKSKCRTHSKS